MCSGGVCKEPVPQSAQSFRTALAAPAIAAHRLVTRDRAALLRAPGGQDTHRDTAQGHAAVWLQLQLALHACAERPTPLAPLQRERALTPSTSAKATSCRTHQHLIRRSVFGNGTLETFSCQDFFRSRSTVFTVIMPEYLTASP